MHVSNGRHFESQVFVERFYNQSQLDNRGSYIISHVSGVSGAFLCQLFLSFVNQCPFGFFSDPPYSDQ